MPLISGLSGHIAPFLVYTITRSSWQKGSHAKRSMGCAFPANGDGLLLTCAHVVRDIADDEMLVVQHPTENHCYRLESVVIHQKLDIAILTIAAKTPFWAQPIVAELPLAVNVFAYGYYDALIENNTVNIIPQVYSGTLTATPRRNDSGLATAMPFYQISFPTFPGFSGSPLYADVQGGSVLCGMLFGNRSSKVVERVLDEYQDGKTHIIEKSVRIWESGVAHTCHTLKEAAKELGKDLWNI